MTNNMTIEELISKVDKEEINIDDYVGYVYLTEFLDAGKKYIGKKNFMLTSNVKLGKKEKAALPVTRGRKQTKKKVRKESDWRTYYGSSVEVKELVWVHPAERIKRTVLRLCKTSKALTYYECKYMFECGVLESNNEYLNENILGRFFSKDLRED